MYFKEVKKEGATELKRKGIRLLCGVIKNSAELLAINSVSLFSRHIKWASVESSFDSIQHKYNVRKEQQNPRMASKSNGQEKKIVTQINNH